MAITRKRLLSRWENGRRILTSPPSRFTIHNPRCPSSLLSYHVKQDERLLILQKVQRFYRITVGYLILPCHDPPHIEQYIWFFKASRLHILIHSNIYIYIYIYHRSHSPCLIFVGKYWRAARPSLAKLLLAKARGRLRVLVLLSSLVNRRAMQADNLPMMMTLEA